MSALSTLGVRYRLQPNGNYQIYCGRTPDNRQFILGGKDQSSACVVFFDSDGQYLGWEERFVAPGELAVLPPPGFSLSQEKWTAEVAKRLLGIIAELRGDVHPINVFEFAVVDANFDMSISKIPWYLQCLLDDPVGAEKQVGTAEFQRLMGVLAEWNQRGDFVFTWGGDYHVNKNGEIVSS